MASDRQGFSLIEILVVIAVIGIITAFTIPRLGDISNNDGLKQDVEVFINAVGQAQSSVNSGDSRGCPTDTHLDRVIVQDISTSGFSVASYCETDSPGAGNTPTPFKKILYKAGSSTLSGNSQFAIFTPNSGVTITPNVTIAFSRGSNNCQIKINSAGALESTGVACP